RLAHHDIVVDEHRDLVVGVQRREFRRHLLSTEENSMDLVFQLQLLKSDRDFQAISSRICVNLDHCRSPGRVEGFAECPRDPATALDKCISSQLSFMLNPLWIAVMAKSLCSYPI